MCDLELKKSSNPKVLWSSHQNLNFFWLCIDFKIGHSAPEILMIYDLSFTYSYLIFLVSNSPWFDPGQGWVSQPHHVLNPTLYISSNPMTWRWLLWTVTVFSGLEMFSFKRPPHCDEDLKQRSQTSDVFYCQNTESELLPTPLILLISHKSLAGL